ncbi:Cytochrome oxidase biogenesis protein Sco1/SenC/PrrC, putative copper metallochaperone [Acidisarcina polymorpha]|uniref:Cytochrome oxidase biogenesis protein Sco1/SenC/PrrC, putative copper metallochaperone n=1 Tax=Acidisarcina polymorpha TaxID=2211140 RepID=A0A2Z5FZT5_9BACT|nr:SCO family protein [Acidisarcina polymorpha]AXC11856.1 Cytochrome oxidase biogenesis protein Sco1/SenC/PrrC, putative copper metallochaperone [Acidisarcina polymorpha]
MKRFLFCLLIAALASIVCGCKHNAQGSESQDAQASATIAAGKQYPVKGKVISTDPTHGEVTLEAAAIPGFMEAMTMPYKLRTPNILTELHPGDQITGTLYVTDTNDVLDQIVITAQGQPDYKPPIQYHVLNPGDLVPDFRFLNQSGKHISIADFKGKALLLTFIYTRCPLPDFCPRMSQNFAKIDKALAADPALYAKTHLLTISFDPEYDTPAVLRSYGGAYTGEYSQERFIHWDFAAPSKKDQEAVDEFFDVGATPEKDRTITHSLSTVLIGPDGKVVHWYPTNDWTPEQVLADIKQVIS